MYRIGLEAFRFEERDAPLYRLDPRAKLLVAMVNMILTILINSQLIQLLLTAILLSTLLGLGRLGHKMVKNIITLAPLMALVFLANYLVSGDLLSSLLPTQKLLNLVMSLNTFFLTTNPDDFAITLEKMGAPLTITLAFSLSLRFIYVLAKVLTEIVEAQLSRGHRLDSGGITTRVRNYAAILIPLIIISVRKSITVAETLELRGFREGAKHTPFTTMKIGIWDIAYLAVYISLAIVLLVYSAEIEAILLDILTRHLENMAV